MSRFGDQTVTVYRRRRVKATTYVDDGSTVTDGCSIQPMGTAEQTERGLTVERRWRGFAPPEFRARAQDQVVVTPGPTTEAGEPLRLELDGPVEPWLRHGVEHHVEFLLVSRD